MRKAVLAIFVVASLLTTTCSKSSSGNKKSLYGKWKLVQLATYWPNYVFFDYTGEPTYITFHLDGTFTSSQLIIDNGEYKRFTILNDSTIAIHRVNGQSSTHVACKIEGDTLTMFVPCIQPCGEKFTKVN